MKKILIITIVINIFLLTSCASVFFYRNAELGNVDKLKSLLAKNTININKPDYKKDTALLIAIQKNKIDAVKFLLENGADPNYQRPDSITPLRSAIDNENEKIVALLLENGADVNIDNANGWVPLMSAARSGNLSIVKMLIDKGANVYARTLNGYTPSAIALQYENFHIKDYLQSIQEKLLSEKKETTQKTTQKNTPTQKE